MSLAAVRVCGDGAERLETRAGLPRVGAVARVERAVVQEPLDLVAQLAQPLRRSGVSLHARESNQRGAKMEEGPPSFNSEAEAARSTRPKRRATDQSAVAAMLLLLADALLSTSTGTFLLLLSRPRN